MKAKKSIKGTRFVAIVLCGCLMIGGAATVFGAQGAGGIFLDGSYLRPIKANYLDEREEGLSADSLEQNSKWREVPEEIPEWSELDDPNATLKEHLETVISEELTDWESCAPGAQVWEFKVDPEEGEASYDEVRQWCLEREKGEKTNEDFLNDFTNNRVDEE